MSKQLFDTLYKIGVFSEIKKLAERGADYEVVLVPAVHYVDGLAIPRTFKVVTMYLWDHSYVFAWEE